MQNSERRASKKKTVKSPEDPGHYFCALGAHGALEVEAGTDDYSDIVESAQVIRKSNDIPSFYPYHLLVWH